jgi:hypothetical protein
MDSWRRAALLICALVAGQGRGAAQTEATTPVPFGGCYERIYDSAHLAAHRGQIVRHVRLSVGKTSMPETPGDKQPIVADALLQIWAGGEKRSFGSIGACFEEGEALMCNAALSAQETELCKNQADGVRQCRLSMDDSGSFQLAPRPGGLLLTVRERLELAGSEGGPWLYLKPDNAENHAFLLQRISAAPCK